MKSKNLTINPSLWWIISVVLGLAIATIWWFGREIRTIDQRIEIMEKK